MTNSDGFSIATRIGFVARGVMYLAIGFLVIGLGRAEGVDGALQFLGDGLGESVLLVAAAGFGAYGLWRVSDVFFANEHPGNSRKMLAKRAGSGVSGVVHLMLAWQTLKLWMGASRSSDSTDQQAQTVLELPGGQLILAAVAVGFAIAGIAQLIKAHGCSFLDNLSPEARHNAVRWLGRIGYGARGIIFLIVAYYLATAAIDGEGWKAGGTEQVFAWLSRPLSLVLAAGLFLFGLYALIEAWYRRIHTPDPEQLDPIR